MVMTDKHLWEINLKPRTAREYLDLMYIIVTLEHYYRKMKIDKRNSDLPKNYDIDKLVIKFLKEYQKCLL